MRKRNKYYGFIKRTNSKIIIICLFLFMLTNPEYFKVKINYLNYINVAYAFDNIYYYIAHVSMKSIMLNQKTNTFIIFHILVSLDIFKEQKEVIDKICLEHKNCKIIYHLLTNEFKKFNVKGRIIKTTAVFYRLLLQNIITNEKKVLYFDCDTLIYRDLNEIYNYNITDKYYIGQFEGKPLKKYGNNLNDFINSGVMLINLENLRKDNIFDKMLDFLKNNKNLEYLDQDAINVVCNKKNGFFPSNYISFGICNIKLFQKKINSKNNNTNVINNNPYIFHFKKYKKPWLGISDDNNLICYDQLTRFYEFARKTNYYFEILNKFTVLKNNLFDTKS